MITYRIAVIDDEKTIREGLVMALEGQYEVQAFSTAKAGIAALEHRIPDLVLLDVGLPDLNGIDVLSRLKKKDPNILVIIITAQEDVGTAVSAMKRGAYDYLTKPFRMDALRMSIRKALETARLRKEVQVLQEKYLIETVPCFIAESSAIQDVMDFVKQVAASADTPVLIRGETGTGKELIAAAIHYRSPNFEGPLVTVNCAAIASNLVESELFGYEKGAFSGAGSTKKGLIEDADGGTLFLDEVGDLSLEGQAKVLRFLEEGEFYRVGGTKKLHVRTRVVSATNKDLEKMMSEGFFRRDLYFRLGVVNVKIPSLKERREDILPLAKHFLTTFARKFGKVMTGIAADGESALKAHEWVGNVRELKNLMEGAVLIGKGPELTASDLGLRTNGRPVLRTGSICFPPLPKEGIDFSILQEDMERFYFEEALHRADGNESAAAKLLGMNHHTFRYRHKKILA